MKTSEQLGELADALAKAQGTMKPPVKNREVTVTMKSGGKYKFRYATLDSVFDSCQKALAENGLAIVQCPEVDANKVTIVTKLMHKSGQWIETGLLIVSEGVNPQAIGSAISYGRRYAIASMLGLASEEDDDGNAAEGNDAEGRDLPQRTRAANGAKPAKQSTADRVAQASTPSAVDKAKGMTLDERFTTATDLCRTVEQKKWAQVLAHVQGHPDFNADQKMYLVAVLEIRKYEYDMGEAAERGDAAFKAAILQEERQEVLTQLEGIVSHDPRVLDRGKLLELVGKRALELDAAEAAAA